MAEEPRRSSSAVTREVYEQAPAKQQRAERIIADLQVSASEFVPKKADLFPLGGRLRHFLNFWRQLTRDPEILHMIMGVSIPFTELPTQECAPRPYPADVSVQNTIRLFVKDLLETQVIVPVDKQPDQFVSPFFLVTNNDGSLRGILNVKTLNQDFLQTTKFKMETLLKVLPLIQPGDWFGSWDVRKGYYNIAVHPDFQKYFCFDFEGQRYMFKALVMGISIAPYIFSKLMATIVKFARAAGIDVSFYLDDTLLRGPTWDIAWVNLRVFGQLLELAGFLLHEGKSVTEPSQVIKYLGFIIDSRDMTIRLPAEKEDKIRATLRQALHDAHHKVPWSVRRAAQLIGWLIAAIPACKYGQGHFRPLENAKKWALIEAGSDYDVENVVWSHRQQETLRWWLNLPHPVVRCFQLQPFTDEFTTDASLEGWGVVYRSSHYEGPWEDRDDPIDELELTTILIALQLLPVLRTNANLKVYCDNTVAISYINKMGGNVRRLDRIARRIWDLLESHSAFLTAVYVASADNVADQYTRGFDQNAKRFFDLEVQLNPRIFRERVFSHGPFVPTIDWFASCHNAQLSRFCAWQEGLSGACFVDAFAHDWGLEVGYMFPPFCLLPKVLQKVLSDKAKIVLIHPDWPGALWRPLLNSKWEINICWCYIVLYQEGNFEFTPILFAHSRDDPVPGPSSGHSRSSALSDPSDPPSSYEEAVLGCLMDRWRLNSQSAWETIFAALAPSTLKSYKLIFLKFLRFMKNVQADVNTVTLEQVFQFLEPLVVEKKAASTIRAYVASLKFYLALFERKDIVESHLLSLFAEGAQRKAPIPNENVWVWDVGIPLKMIRDRAPPSNFLSAAREALFLILMATGIRIDDAFKLGDDFVLDQGSFVIPFLEKRKCPIKKKWTKNQRIASYPGNERLCPGNALLLYATFSVTIRDPSEKFLFISSTGKRASKDTLARWVKDILLEAGIKAPAGSCRSATTSAAFLRKIPVSVILSSAGWSSDLVFFKHYQRQVTNRVLSANLLPVL